MPPKKQPPTASITAAGEESTVRRWTPENEKKLLFLTLNRALTADDYARLVTAFPGTTVKALQVKCSKLRVEQRDMYEKLGWAIEVGTVGPKKRKAGAEGEGTPKKNRSKKDANGESAEDTPVKKSRARKAKIVERSEDDGEEVGVPVKMEEEIQGEIEDEV